MIQRIQTVYILLFSICLFTASLAPFARFSSLEDNVYCLYATGWVSESSLDKFHKYPFYLSYLISISFAILMLVNYRKRSKQLRYGKICYLFVLLSLVIMFLEFNNGLSIFKITKNIVYSYSMYLLVASFPLIFLANRAIKKDDQLVKSVDRLR